MISKTGFQNNPEPGYLFDSLTHATADGTWFSTSKDASLTRLLNHIREFNVAKSIITGLPDLSLNSYMLSVYEKYPNVFYPVPALLKQSPEMTLQALKTYKLQGIHAVKIHPRLVGIRSIDDPWLHDTIELCENEELILFLCTVFTGISTDRHSIPKLLGHFCRKHKHLKFVFLHGGYVDLLQTAEEIRPFENALLDISATLTRFYDSSIGLDIKFLIRTFDKRLAIGTDFPENTYHDVFDALDYLGFRRMDITARPYMGKNLLRFLLGTEVSIE